MSEPLYTFIRGTGWVPTTYRQFECTDVGGRRLLLVDRLPQKGDRYLSIRTDTSTGARMRNWLNDPARVDRYFREFSRRMAWKRFEELTKRRTPARGDLLYVVVESV